MKSSVMDIKKEIETWPGKPTVSENSFRDKTILQADWVYPKKTRILGSVYLNSDKQPQYILAIFPKEKKTIKTSWEDRAEFLELVEKCE